MATAGNGEPPAKKARATIGEGKIHLKYWAGRGLMEVPRMLLALSGKVAGDDYALMGVTPLTQIKWTGIASTTLMTYLARLRPTSVGCR